MKTVYVGKPGVEADSRGRQDQDQDQERVLMIG